MAKTYDLTQGDISGGIRRVALPLITASFVQMAYSMTDMIWLGRLGSESVAAVGVAGFFAWICNALSFTSKVGAEVTISQSLGSRSPVRARIYANQAAQLSSVMALCYALFVYAAAPFDKRVARNAKRNWNAEEVSRREAKLLPSEEKIAKADFVLTNDGTEEEWKRKARELGERLKKL